MIQHFTSDFQYLEDVEVETPNKDEIIKEGEEIDSKLINAANKEEAIKAIKEYFDFSDDIHTMSSLIYIRHTIDTRDKKYSELSDLLNEISPRLMVSPIK